MANSTIFYACTPDGLAIFNKPGTAPEWLPPRLVLKGREVTSAWAEPGPPIRALAAVDGILMVSESGGGHWEAVVPPPPAPAPAPPMTTFPPAPHNNPPLPRHPPRTN